MGQHILRYELPDVIDSWFAFELPYGSKIVHFGEKPDHSLHIWVEAEPDPLISMTHQFIILPTGAELPFGMEHLGTVVTSNGFVWHLYQQPVTW